MKVHSKIRGARRGPRKATPIPSKTPLVWKHKYGKAFLSLLTTEEYSAHNFRFQLNCQQQKPRDALSTEANPFFEVNPTVWRWG